MVYFYFEGKFTPRLPTVTMAFILRRAYFRSEPRSVASSLTQPQLAVFKTCEGLVKAEFRCFHTAQTAPLTPVADITLNPVRWLMSTAVYDCLTKTRFLLLDTPEQILQGCFLVCTYIQVT